MFTVENFAAVFVSGLSLVDCTSKIFQYFN